MVDNGVSLYRKSNNHTHFTTAGRWEGGIIKMCTIQKTDEFR
jgi:hypothetical protein